MNKLKLPILFALLCIFSCTTETIKDIDEITETSNYRGGGDIINPGPPVGPGVLPYSDICIPINFIIPGTSGNYPAEADIPQMLINLNNVFSGSLTGNTAYNPDPRRIKFNHYDTKRIANAALISIDNQQEYNELLSVPNTYEWGMLNVYLLNDHFNWNEVGAGFALGIPETRLVMITQDNLHLEASSFSHEIGHTLGLYHTHETQFGIECADGSNSLTAGDKIVDTPADSNLIGSIDIINCVYQGNFPIDDGCGGFFNPDLDNIMSYYGICRTGFTGGQHLRMNSTALSTGVGRSCGGVTK